MEKYPSIKRVLLYSVVGGLVLASLIGIYVLLFGTFGETEEKILMTTLSISYFSVTSLACAAAYEKRRHALLSILGFIISIAGFALFLPGIWAEWLDSNSPISKIIIILTVLSFSFAQACLLSLVTLQRRVVWVYYAAVGAILALAAIISLMIVYDQGGWMLRLAGAVGILDGCLSLCIPILHRLSGTLPITAYQQIELVCPRCGQGGSYPIGSIKCRGCSLVINIRIEAASQVLSRI
jgi:hypothetical protein